MVTVNILIVEDENIVALDIRRTLENAGYQVAGVCISGEETISIFPELLPDLVLMDIKLQGEMDGLETAETLKRDYDVPVIFLTAFSEETTIKRAKFLNPFGYIIKPFTDRELLITIEMALYKNKTDLELKIREERYRKFFEDDMSGNFVADGEGFITECNSAFVRLFEYPVKDEILGLKIDVLFPDITERDTFWKELDKMKKLELVELSLQTKYGVSKVCFANVVGIYTNGRLKEIKGYLTDITERKRLEEQLRQAQKMEAIGRLAGGVAHDFNNILTVIMGYTSILIEETEGKDNQLSEITGIQNASKKAANLTRQLLAFSRRQELKPVIVDVNQIIHDMEKMIRRLITEDISMQLFLEAEEPFVFVDPGQFEQVLINLSVNARDAMPEGGKLLIETNNIRIPSPDYSFTVKIPFGKYVMMTVIDTGVGIPENTKVRIFEPFFTTKPEGSGTGLGLATVYGIVEQSGGYIDLLSEEKKGTSFRLLFPQQKNMSNTNNQVEKRQYVKKGTETVLLVEDEENLRSLLFRILVRAGYNVLSASNAGEAILIYEKQAKNIKLMVTDIVMPHISGDRLSLRLLKENPELKVIFISGYPVETLLERGFPIENTQNFLQKPFEPMTLANKIRTLLDNH